MADTRPSARRSTTSGARSRPPSAGAGSPPARASSAPRRTVAAPGISGGAKTGSIELTEAEPTTIAPSSLVRRVWQRFQDVGFTPDFGVAGSRLLIALYRQLARDGTPIPADELARIAAEIGVSSDEATSLVEGAGERDDDGALRGIVGLSLNDHPHRFRVNGHELRNWCAIDPLLIAPPMTSAVELESADPQSGEPVRVKVAPDGAQAHEPGEAVISIVVPAPGATDSVEAVWMMFCNQVHFFASRATGERFFAERDAEVYFLSIEEAFELGRLVFAPVYEQL